MRGWKGGGAAGEGGIPHYSLPALATSLLRLSTRELPGATLLCAFGPGPRILLGGAYPGAGAITRATPGLRASAAASTAKGGSTRPAYFLCKCRARIARLTFLAKLSSMLRKALLLSALP